LDEITVGNTILCIPVYAFPHWAWVVIKQRVGTVFLMAFVLANHRGFDDDVKLIVQKQTGSYSHVHRPPSFSCMKEHVTILRDKYMRFILKGVFK
jgi:hypothetical protein